MLLTSAIPLATCWRSTEEEQTKNINKIISNVAKETTIVK